MNNAANATKIIASAINTEDGTAAEITLHAGGYAVAFKDTDAGEYLPTVKVFAKFAAAVAYAEEIAHAAIAASALIRKYDVTVLCDPPPIPTNAIYCAYASELAEEISTEWAETPAAALAGLLERVADWVEDHAGPVPPAAVPVPVREPVGTQWALLQAMPHFNTPYFAEIGNGLYCRVGTGKKRRRR